MGKSKIIFLFAFLSIFKLTCYAQQNFRLGLKFNDDKYEKAPQLAKGAKSIDTYPVISLKKYNPYPGYQGECESCVTWAVCYSAFSTSWAIKNNIINRDMITRNAFSPMYIYVQISNNCDDGSQLGDALRLLKEKGDCNYSDFGTFQFSAFDKDLGAKIDELRLKSTKNHIKDFAAIFELHDNDSTKIAQTKLSLSDNRPVIIGINVDDTFKGLNKENPVWHPNQSKFIQTEGHALCVIGYNDFTQEFELLNSWGNSWGNDGYCYIKYKDYAKAVRYGFQLTLDDRTIQVAPIEINGNFELDKLTWNDQLNQTQSNEIKPTLVNNEYLINSDIHKNDFFRLIARNIKSNCYVYVFSIDPNGESNILFPLENNNKKVPITNQNEVIEIPGNGKAIQTDVSGIDHMCILYCYYPIDKIEDVVAKIRASQKLEMIDKIKDVLGDRIIPDKNLIYSNDVMGITGNSTQGDIAPICLNVSVR